MNFTLTSVFSLIISHISKFSNPTNPFVRAEALMFWFNNESHASLGLCNRESVKGVSKADRSEDSSGVPQTVS